MLLASEQTFAEEFPGMDHLCEYHPLLEFLAVVGIPAKLCRNELFADLNLGAAEYASGIQQTVAAVPSQASGDVSAEQTVVTFEGWKNPLEVYQVEPRFGHPH